MYMYKICIYNLYKHIHTDTYIHIYRDKNICTVEAAGVQARTPLPSRASGPGRENPQWKLQGMSRISMPAVYRASMVQWRQQACKQGHHYQVQVCGA